MSEIQERKTVWVAYTNTDCTEGRGKEIPKAVCETEATAIRLGKKGYVMGSDCPVRESLALKVKGVWLVPGLIVPENDDDKATQSKINKKREALEKARKAGLTEDDLKALIT